MDKIDAITKKLIEQKKLEEKMAIDEVKDVIEEEVEDTIGEELEDVVTGAVGSKVDGDNPKDVEDAVKHVETGATKVKDTPVAGVTKVAEEEEIDEDVIVHIHTDTEEVYIEEPEPVEDVVSDYEEPYEDEYEYYESTELDEEEQEDAVEHVTLEKKKIKEEDEEDDEEDDDEEDEEELDEGKKPSKEELLKRFGDKKAKPFDKDKDDDKDKDNDKDKDDDKDDDKKKDKKESSQFDEKRLEVLFKGYIDKSYGDLAESFDTPQTVQIKEAFLNRNNNSLDLSVGVTYEGKETETVISVEDFDLEKEGEFTSPVSESGGALFGQKDQVVLNYEIKEGIVRPNSLDFEVKIFAENEEVAKVGKISLRKKN